MVNFDNKHTHTVMFSKTCLLFVVLLFNLVLHKPWSKVKCLDKPGLVKKLETIYLCKESIKYNRKHGVFSFESKLCKFVCKQISFLVTKE